MAKAIYRTNNRGGDFRGIPVGEDGSVELDILAEANGLYDLANPKTGELVIGKCKIGTEAGTCSLVNPPKTTKDK